jgi:hypothetical protein
MSEIENNMQFALCPFCGKDPSCGNKFELYGHNTQDRVAQIDAYQDDKNGFSCVLVCKQCGSTGPVSGVFDNHDDAIVDAIDKWQTRRILH